MQKASQLSRPSPTLKTSRVNTSYSTALSKLSPSPRAAMFRKRMAIQIFQHYILLYVVYKILWNDEAHFAIEGKILLAKTESSDF